MAEFTEDQNERMVDALESIAASLESIDGKLDKLINKSPWDDPKTKALLGAAMSGSGMEEEVAARGFDVNGD